MLETCTGQLVQDGDFEKNAGAKKIARLDKLVEGYEQALDAAMGVPQENIDSGSTKNYTQQMMETLLNVRPDGTGQITKHTLHLTRTATQREPLDQNTRT